MLKCYVIYNNKLLFYILNKLFLLNKLQTNDQFKNTAIEFAIFNSFKSKKFRE